MTYLAIKLGAWALSGLACLTLLWDAHKAPDSLPKTTGQQTITLTSIVPTTPAPTTTVPKGCAEYVADAITAGWPADQAPMLARVMFRESRCNPLAYNGADTNGGSRGLMQINGTHETWLIEAGIITKLDDLFYPDVNIAAAVHLYGMVGWSAWAATHG
jgi:Transglycosylase SLT domain